MHRRFIHVLEELDQFCMAFKFQPAHPFSLPKMYYGAMPKFEPCVKTDGDGRQSQKHVLPLMSSVQGEGHFLDWELCSGFETHEFV